MSTFTSKRLLFLSTRIHIEIRDRTGERTHTGNVRFGTCVKGQCFARKLRIHCATADSHNYWSRVCGFRPTTRQRIGCLIYTMAKWNRGRLVLEMFSTFSSSTSLSASYW